MLRIDHSKSLSPADRAVYREWIRRVVAFYAACAFIVGALALSMHTEVAPREASVPNSAPSKPLELKVVSAP